MAKTAQFIHIDWCGARGAKKKKSARNRKLTERFGMKFRNHAWTASEIMDECERKKLACRHVTHPTFPKILHGCKPREVVAMGEAWARTCKPQSYHRKLKSGKIIGVTRRRRQDSPFMLNGIVSLPDFMREQDWPAYKEKAIQALRERYGDRLKSVAEHTDEDNPHFHFYCVPDAGEEFGVLHPGYGARQKARGAGERAGVVLKAFKSEMVGFQNWFHQASCGDEFGVSRVGVGRQRESRGKALVLKRQAAADKRVADAKVDAKKVVMKARETARGLIEQAHSDVTGMMKDAHARLLRLDSQLIAKEDFATKAAEMAVEVEDRMRKGIEVLGGWIQENSSKLPSSMIAPLMEKLRELEILGSDETAPVGRQSQRAAAENLSAGPKTLKIAPKKA